MKAKILEYRSVLLLAALGMGVSALGVQYLAHTPTGLTMRGEATAENSSQVFVQAEDVDVKVFVHVNSGSGS